MFIFLSRFNNKKKSYCCVSLLTSSVNHMWTTVSRYLRGLLCVGGTLNLSQSVSFGVKIHYSTVLHSCIFCTEMFLYLSFRLRKVILFQ